MPLAFGDERLDAIAAEHPAGSLRAAAECRELGVDVNVSIGAASPAAGTDTLSAVLSRVDEALYEAKRTARGRAVRY